MDPIAPRKTVLITGCSEGGIGDGLAKAFHKAGLRVFASARNLSKIAHFDALGIETIQLDVTDPISIQAAVKTISALTNGTLDFLVNNSGGGYSMPLTDTTTPLAQSLFTLNVFSVVALTNAFLPLLIASKGTIINNTSSAAKAPISWQAFYNASKAALLTISDSYRMELAPFDVKVLAIITGAVNTNFFSNLKENGNGNVLPEGSLYEPAREEIERVLRGGGENNAAVEVDVFAGQVVQNALSKRPKKHLWVGGSSWFLWSIYTFGWETVWDLVMRLNFGLDGVERKIRAARVGVVGSKEVLKL